jgi:hypothetical protein
LGLLRGPGIIRYVTVYIAMWGGGSIMYVCSWGIITWFRHPTVCYCVHCRGGGGITCVYAIGVY